MSRQPPEEEDLLCLQYFGTKVNETFQENVDGVIGSQSYYTLQFSIKNLYLERSNYDKLAQLVVITYRKSEINNQISTTRNLPLHYFKLFKSNIDQFFNIGEMLLKKYFDCNSYEEWQQKTILTQELSSIVAAEYIRKNYQLLCGVENPLLTIDSFIFFIANESKFRPVRFPGIIHHNNNLLSQKQQQRQKEEESEEKLQKQIEDLQKESVIENQCTIETQKIVEANKQLLPLEQPAEVQQEIKQQTEISTSSVALVIVFVLFAILIAPLI